MKISELSGVLLDYWVARVEIESIDSPLWECELKQIGDRQWMLVQISSGLISGVLSETYHEFRDITQAHSHDVNFGKPPYYSPRQQWWDGGPIIERERLDLIPACGDARSWFAQDVSREGSISYFGPTLLIAAMRTYVASKFGNEVPDAFAPEPNKI